MEVVLDLDSHLHSELEPMICMDEASIQLTGHVFELIPLKPGDDAKEDYHYFRAVRESAERPNALAPLDNPDE